MSAEDFATVRAVVATTYLGHPDDEALAALARIEARLAEVERERNANKNLWIQATEVAGRESIRAEAAEARLAEVEEALRLRRKWGEAAERERDNWHASNYAERQARLAAEARLAEVEKQRDAAVEAQDWLANDAAEFNVRAEAAEARVMELEEGK